MENSKISKEYSCMFWPCLVNVWHVLVIVGTFSFLFLFLTCFDDRWKSSGWLGGAPRVIKGYSWKMFGWFVLQVFEIVLVDPEFIQGPSGAARNIFAAIQGPPLCHKGMVVFKSLSKMWCPTPFENGFNVGLQPRSDYSFLAQTPLQMAFLEIYWASPITDRSHRATSFDRIEHARKS